MVFLYTWKASRAYISQNMSPWYLVNVLIFPNDHVILFPKNVVVEENQQNLFPQWLATKANDNSTITFLSKPRLSHQNLPRFYKPYRRDVQFEDGSLNFQKPFNFNDESCPGNITFSRED